MTEPRSGTWRVVAIAVLGVVVLAVAVFLAVADWRIDEDGMPYVPGLFGGSTRVEYPGIEVEPGGGGGASDPPDSRAHRTPPDAGDEARPGDPRELVDPTHEPDGR